MSPRSSRSSPASRDAVETGGRHRRPDSPADVAVPRMATAHYRSPGATAAARGAAAPFPRAGAHSRNGRSNRPPITGSHRRPGTLPIESWLLIGKTRRQLLLASLVALALIVVAVPAQQRRDGIDAVNAAAERAVGVHPAPKTTSTGFKTAKGKGSTTAAGKAAKAPEPTASPAPSGSARPGTTEPGLLGQGPGHSLRTTGTRSVALTFDDGPDPVQTPKILALLAQYQLTATFCLIGQNVQRHPEIVREIVAAGHTLCDHTWNHSLTIGKDKPDAIQADLARTNAAIRAAVPGAKIPFFRAPGGNFTDRLVSVAAGDGMASLYWQVDPQDWNHLPGETNPAHITRVIANLHKFVKPGSIILSHDFNQPDTIEAYTELLPWLKQNFQIGLPGAPAPAPTGSPSAPAATPSAPPTDPAPAPSEPATTAPATDPPATEPATAPAAE